jgi:outer membrane protein
MRLISKIFIILFLTGTIFPQKVLTLNEAINIALQKNSTLQKNLNTLKTFESGLLASYGNLLPSLNASGSWSWSRSEDEGTTYNFGGAVFTNPPSTIENRSYSAGVNSSWTLFDGLANYASVSQSQNQLESARLSLERLKQDIVFQTTSLYYDVINAQQLLKVKEDDLRQAQKNYETISERNRLGAVTLADVYAQQVRLGNAELEEIRARNDLETIKSNLLFYLGIDVFENYSFNDELSNKEMDVIKNKLSKDYENLTDLVSKAMDKRLDYQSALLNLESAYNGITIARSGHLPRLTNSMSFNTYANKLDNLFDNKNYSVGLTLSIPIFSGFSVSDRVEVATVNAMNREVELSDLQREIKRNIQKTYLDLQAVEKSLSVSEKNVEAARENLRIEEEKYQLGSSRLLDVLTATSNYTNARVSNINVQFAFIVLSEQLKYYLGVIDYKNYE